MSRIARLCNSLAASTSTAASASRTCTSTESAVLPGPEVPRRLAVNDVDGTLGDADQGRHQVPARPLTIASAAWVYGAVLRDKNIADYDVLATRPTHAGGEPRVQDVIV